MIKKIIRNGLLVSLALGFAGCANTPQPEVVQVVKEVSHGSMDDRVRELANRLLDSSRLDQEDLGNIALTPFVDLHQLNKTTMFGRSLGEGMFNELFTRGFNVVDFRGQSALSVNADGEFFLTRDVKKMKEAVNNTYVLVGTYNRINGTIILNARIIDNMSGTIVATAKTSFKSNNCSLLGDCPKPIAPRRIKITTDNCSTVGCPTNYCPTGSCN